MAATVTGEDATLYLRLSTGTLSTGDVELWAISDFSLTLDRGTVEQELVGQIGNYFTQGSLSAEGSITNCRFAASGNSDMLMNLVDTDTYPYLSISGSVGATNPIKWYLVSCQVTNYEISIGDADTISELSADFTVMDPYNLTYDTGLISDHS